MRIVFALLLLTLVPLTIIAQPTSNILQIPDPTFDKSTEGWHEGVETYAQYTISPDDKFPLLFEKANDLNCRYKIEAVRAEAEAVAECYLTLKLLPGQEFHFLYPGRVYFKQQEGVWSIRWGQRIALPASPLGKAVIG